MLKKAIVGIIVGSIVLMSSAGAIYAYHGPNNASGTNQESYRGNHCGTQFIDENNDGICDTRFVDEDKDGICDNCGQICNNSICSQNKESNTYQNQNQNRINSCNENQNGNGCFKGTEQKSRYSIRNIFNHMIQNIKSR